MFSPQVFLFLNKHCYMYLTTCPDVITKEICIKMLYGKKEHDQSASVLVH